MSRVVDSRRLTGPHLLGDHPGAALDVAFDSSEPDPVAAVTAWRAEARRLLDAVGWSGEDIAARTFPGGASLVITAPIDGLYAATDVNEAAWDAAMARSAGGPVDDTAPERLRAAIVRDHDTRLRALRDAARARQVTFLADDELVSAGTGRGAIVWPRHDLPAVPAVDWDEVHDVPIVLVTGSNGKTTSVRLIAAIVTAAGLVPGVTSTDGVRVAGDSLAGGDFAGPMGAR
ncbi:MAG: Mur ligase, partial [Gemmatimonadales bacterium]|nr:Mur ligase [Gemmatimonadales bacterium]